MAKSIMIQGTMSNVGKSLLCAALCRIFKQDGYRTAPFKSQNMALNSYITDDGLEMGRAQAVQAEAAGIAADVRMNPILLKPTSDRGSQVIVEGRVWGQYEARDYFARKKSLIPTILRCYNSLAAENDIIVIEGAGSPAEINLKQDDIVNMGLAELVSAPVLLVGDIDPGGVFAQLYGTVALLEHCRSWAPFPIRGWISMRRTPWRRVFWRNIPRSGSEVVSAPGSDSSGLLYMPHFTRPHLILGSGLAKAILRPALISNVAGAGVPYGEACAAVPAAATDSSSATVAVARFIKVFSFPLSLACRPLKPCPRRFRAVAPSGGIA